jgi:hypothetical protein
MSIEIKDRLFPFDGEDADYITWLESKLFAIQNCPSSRSMTPPTPPRTPEPSINDVVEEWKFVYCSPTRRMQRSPIGRLPSLRSGIRAIGGGRPGQTRVPQWQKELDRLTRNILSGETWTERRERCGFSTVESNRFAIQLMLGRGTQAVLSSRTHGVEVPCLLPPDNSDMILRGCQYGLVANNCAASGRLTILVGKYQKLIFVCYCTVLLSLGNSKDTVNWMMRQYISDSDDKNLERYRLGCLWVNRCVSSLLRLGWGYQSWEIFVLCRSAMASFLDGY